MSKIRRLSLIIALIALALAAWFEPTCCVLGWLRGEAIFEGRPTSYWRRVVEQDLRQDPAVVFGQAPPPRPALWQRALTTLGFRHEENLSLLLIRDANADLVLRELQGDGNNKIAGFAADALNIHPRARAGEWDPMALFWMTLISKHNLKDPDNKRYVELIE